MSKVKPFVISLIYILIVQYTFGQFHPVPKMEVDLSFLTDKEFRKQIKSFSISELITVKEFKEYLVSVKRDSSSEFYQSQLPKSKQFSKSLALAILKCQELQEQPMPGVSWTVARNYCKWLSTNPENKDMEYSYSLPMLSELIAYNQFYKLGQSKELESWTLNAYDESSITFSSIGEYQYSAGYNDPPSMKRKVIYGGSYQMNYDPRSTYNYLQYEYQDSSSRFVGFKIVRTTKDVNDSVYNVNRCKIEIGEKNNRFHSQYLENYENGRSKVIGEYYFGQRVGVWSVWDTNGVLLIQREYLNNNSCNFLFPFSDFAYNKLYEEYPPYTFQRNDEQFYPYRYTEERAVAYSNRLWRQLSTENEPELFRLIDFKKVTSELMKKDLKWYFYGEKGDFKNVVESDSLIALKNDINSWDFSRIEIKEDFFFNKDILLSDTRQVAISFYRNKGDEKPSYTLFYPHTRAILAKFQYEITSLNDLKNLDDFFFFHEYSGEIVNCSSGFGKHFSNDPNCIYDIKKIMTEHDLWISFGR
jgi:hypothetical protein